MKNIKEMVIFILKRALSSVSGLYIYYLHEDLKTIMSLYEIVCNDKIFDTYFNKVDDIDMKTIERDIVGLLGYIEEVFNIELCFEENSIDGADRNIIKKGYSVYHDEFVSLYENTNTDLHLVKNTLSDLIKQLH